MPDTFPRTARYNLGIRSAAPISVPTTGAEMASFVVSFNYYLPFSEAAYSLIPAQRIWQAQLYQAVQYQLDLSAVIFVQPGQLATFKAFRNSLVDIIYHDRKEILTNVFPAVKLIVSRNGKHADRPVWKLEAGKRRGIDKLDELVIDIIHAQLT